MSVNSRGRPSLDLDWIKTEEYKVKLNESQDIYLNEWLNVTRHKSASGFFGILLLFLWWMDEYYPEVLQHALKSVLCTEKFRFKEN